MADDKPYEVLSPTKIRLGSLAKEMARVNGMTEVQMAKHLLQQHKQREAGMTQREGET